MLAKRMILSQINGIYDPLGLVIPFTVKAKIMLRQLCSGDERNLGWDDDIPLELKIGWIRFFQQLFDVDKISFKRCVQLMDAVGKPTLVMNHMVFTPLLLFELGRFNLQYVQTTGIGSKERTTLQIGQPKTHPN